MPSEKVDAQPVDHMISWLRLNSCEINPAKLNKLLRVFDNNPERVLSESALQLAAAVPDLAQSQIRRIAESKTKDFDSELKVLNSLGGHCLLSSSSDYPASLKQLPDAPPLLFVRGSLQAEDKFSIAIVGSRRASAYGLTLASHFGKELSAVGLTVVSGGARGVDTRAHTSALDANGRTVAFIGSGIDVNYPSENRKLFDRIVESGGAVVSEYPIGTRPEPWRFPARNRLISGLSLGVLVIESPIDSGSLITAREAAEQGRDVFAVPGPIDTGRSSGCHRLIKEGAKLVEDVDDILNELGVLRLRSEAPTEKIGLRVSAAALNLPPEQRLIIEQLDLQPKHVDTLISGSGLSAPQVIGILTLLEMRGLAKRVAGNAFIRVLKND